MVDPLTRMRQLAGIESTQPFLEDEVPVVESRASGDEEGTDDAIITAAENLLAAIEVFETSLDKLGTSSTISKAFERTSKALEDMTKAAKAADAVDSMEMGTGKRRKGLTMLQQIQSAELRLGLKYSLPIAIKFHTDSGNHVITKAG